MQKKLRIATKIFENNEVSSKIQLFFSYNIPGDDFDSYEKNYTPVLLNPITIKGYVREINPEALVWKQYGLANIGAKEILCSDKYENYFRTCAKIVIEGIEYQVFREGTGNRAILLKRPFQTLRVVITQNT